MQTIRQHEIHKNEQVPLKVKSQPDIYSCSVITCDHNLKSETVTPKLGTRTWIFGGQLDERRVCTIWHDSDGDLPPLAKDTEADQGRSHFGGKVGKLR